MHIVNGLSPFDVHFSTTPPLRRRLVPSDGSRNQVELPAGDHGGGRNSRSGPSQPRPSGEISIWEILVRLPPRSLLRCRAVCRAWRCATSTRDFLLAHHARQPTLPILCDSKLLDKKGYSLDIIPFDHRAADADQFQSVARFRGTSYGLVACCDGLFILAVNRIFWAIYNPATRQYAPLWMLSGYRIFGMYPHPATGEYRLLMNPRQRWQYGIEPKSQVFCYVLSLGSGQPPRHIEYADANELGNRSVLLRGCLHWYQMDHWIENSTIIVFDTTAESFRKMGAPVVSGWGDLFEMDGMLGISSFNGAATKIDIWVLQDCQNEIWTFKCRIELPVTQIKTRCGNHDDDIFCHVVVMPGDGELLVLVKFKEWLIQVDMDGLLFSGRLSSGLLFSNLHVLHVLGSLPANDKMWQIAHLFT
ncbi:putative F-box protein At1g32420 [Aegilops tauschii subsp. strangulata]|uniref:putative F-box protein At1g32420 n=1 Tax=Aegilops tauschii subsp. strangulata TaxID=200361 RepID=UPI003CC87867